MEDRISELPAPILHHILSFVSDKKAVQTCVVSKSWRHLVSTRPKFSLWECDFKGDKKKLMNVLDKSLQVYYDQKLCIEELGVFMSKVNPRMVLLLEKWIPIVVVNKFHLSFDFQNSVLPFVVFESESLQELFLDTCNLKTTFHLRNKSVVGRNLKTLHLRDVCIEDETFAELLLSCSLIEDLSIRYGKGLRTINMPNHHNLKRFELCRINDFSNIEIYLPSSVGYMSIVSCCPNWYHHRNYFPGLTCLELSRVPLSNEWFNSFSHNFPCLEDLKLENCNGFDELKLSSPSMKNLDITMDESTTKATIDAPSIKMFSYYAKSSQSISFTATAWSEWNSDIYLSLDLDASQWFLELSELVAAFGQSQINSLVLFNSSDFGNPHIEYPSDISICCGASCKPVAIKSLALDFSGVHYDFFFSDLVTGLFRIVRPREIREFGKEEFLCRTLQKGRWEEEGMRSFFSWQQDLEEISLQERFGSGSEEWRPVEGTINWSEYVAALHDFIKLRFRLRWRE